MSGDENDRESDARRGEITLKIQSAPPRQSHIEDQTGRAVGRFGSQKVGNGSKQARMQARGPQQSSEGFAKLRIVVDHHDASI
jgi:hypothetical protein